MNYKKFLAGSSLGFGGILMSAVAVFAATMVVNPANSQGWLFNPDPVNATPYEFTEDEASIGDGSLYVEPISSTPAHKFIAVLPLGVPVADVNSFSYDFLIAGNGTNSDANEFYLNVYTNLEGSTTFYDCRFDYVPSVGSTAAFTTASFAATDLPTAKGDRADAFTCPATLDQMPSGSTVSRIALNVGDTSVNDEGLAGYLDKVVVDLDSDDTTYDFEWVISPNGDKEACKDGGWMTFNSPTFKNQGQCVSYVQANPNAGK